jgi:hypothetical protein
LNRYENFLDCYSEVHQQSRNDKVEPIGSQKPKTVVYGRGGRSLNEIDGVKIKTLGNGKKKRTEKDRKEDKALFKARAGIEPVI